MAFACAARAADSGPAGALEFDAETVCLRVGADSLEVEGLYRFRVRSGTGTAVTIFYPYPTEARLGGARTVRVESRGAAPPWRPVEFRETQDPPGAFWPLAAPPGDSLIEVRSLYRQALRTRYARYIVTTTSGWGRPLRRARFELTLPPGARSPRISDPFRRIERGGRVVYVWEARDFLPRHDIEATWR